MDERQLDRITPQDVIGRFGWNRAMQIIGFCLMWRAAGCPDLETLKAQIREQFAQQGLSKSAAYRYIGELREWADELGWDADRLGGLALQVAKVFDVEDEARVSHARERMV